jgi:7-cyano-7-deazaguanine reductase
MQQPISYIENNENTVFPEIEVFENRFPNRRYTIQHECPEFTAVCPKTALPDFGNVIVTYIPNKLCIELKSYKYYMLAYRHVGMFHENVTNQVLEHIVAACQPHWIEVKSIFKPRGGINSIVTATHGNL